MKKWLVLVGLLAAVGAAAVVWQLGLVGARRETPAYRTAAVDRGSIRRVVIASGTVNPVVIVEVGSQLSGQIAELDADFNSRVKAGQVIARLDPKTFKARVDQAQADLAVARAAVSVQQAGVAKSEALLHQAQRDLTRQQRLAAQGNVSASTLDAAGTQVETASADLVVARAQVDNAQAVVTSKQASLEQARIDLERSVIRSPIDGVVIERNVNVGQTVAASLQAPTVFKIAQNLTQVQIEAQVNEADIGNVSSGNPVTFTVDAYPEHPFEGHVSQVRLAATTLQNVVTYTVVIDAENPDGKLLPGMTANAEIVTGSVSDVLRVPNEALRFRPPQMAVNAASATARRERLVEQLQTALQLDPSQVAALRRALQKFQPAAASGDRGTVDSAALQAAFRQLVATTLQPLLKPQQQQAFSRWQAQRLTQRSGIVWVLGADGQPQRRTVQLGLSDDRYSAVTGGDLKPGERVIIGVSSKPA